MKTTFLIAYKDSDGEWRSVDSCRHVENAHADARYSAARNPSTEYGVFQLVGVHIAPVLPPRYTAVDEPTPLLIMAGPTR